MLEPPSPCEEAPQPAPKKQTPKTSQPPLTIWDNVSKVWLTKRTLEEFDRRVREAQSAPSPVHQHTRRPSTRAFSASLERKARTYQDTSISSTRYWPRFAKRIKLFARRGGPDLSSLRNYHEYIRPMPRKKIPIQTRDRNPKPSTATTQNDTPLKDTSETESTGPFDQQFEQVLIDNGVYPVRHPCSNGTRPPKPNNWRELKERLVQRRPSLTPSKFTDEDLHMFRRADVRAKKKLQMHESVLPLIEGKIADGRCRSGAVPFGNLAALTDRPLTHAVPDVYYGARPEQLDWEVRNALGDKILPSTQHDLPIVPNFFLEAKLGSTVPLVAERQVLYDGALGTRAMRSLQSYGQPAPAYDGNAYAASSLYYGGTLQLFTSHAGPPRDASSSRPETYLNQLGAFAMSGSPETFRAGATAYRNLRDWSKEQRDEAISQANERARALRQLPTDDANNSPTASFVAVEEVQPSFSPPK